MAKKSPKTSAGPRDRTIAVKLSAEEFQLLDHAASQSRSRGTGVWMRDRLIEAARQTVGEPLAASILEGKATLELMKASLEESRGAKTPAAKTPPDTPPARSRRQAGMK